MGVRQATSLVVRYIRRAHSRPTGKRPAGIAPRSGSGYVKVRLFCQGKPFVPSRTVPEDSSDRTKPNPCSILHRLLGPPSSPAKLRPQEPQGGERDARSSDDGNGKVGGETESSKAEAESVLASHRHRHPPILPVAQHCGGALSEEAGTPGKCGNSGLGNSGTGKCGNSGTGNGTVTAPGPSWVRRGSESKSAHAVASGNGNGSLGSCAASCAASCAGAGMAVRWRTNQRSPRGLECVCCMSGCGKVRKVVRAFCMEWYPAPRQSRPRCALSRCALTRAHPHAPLLSVFLALLTCHPLPGRN
jgi:hypothetical protein